MWPMFKRKAKSGSVPAAPRPAAADSSSFAVLAQPSAAEAASSKAAPGIAYDPGLIAKLRDDHQALFALHRALSDDARSKRFHAIPAGLLAFRRAFQTHLLVESVRFYIYLEKLLAANPEELAYARSLKHEMNAIARTVASFIETWSSAPPGPQGAQSFVDQLDAIGEAFTHRVELEESTLYTLYVESL